MPRAFKSVQVGDLYAPAGGRFYRIIGVYLGAGGQENLVGLVALDRDPGSAHGETVDEMFVPLDMLEATAIYRRVDHGAELGPRSNLALDTKITVMGR